MSVVAQTCDRVVVMYAGTSIERGTVATIFESPRHPYTQALIGCIPRGLTGSSRLKGIEETVPTVAQYPSGCRFHPRCSRAEAICSAEVPKFIEGIGGAAACHFALGTAA